MRKVYLALLLLGITLISSYMYGAYYIEMKTTEYFNVIENLTDEYGELGKQSAYYLDQKDYNTTLSTISKMEIVQQKILNISHDAKMYGDDKHNVYFNAVIERCLAELRFLETSRQITILLRDENYIGVMGYEKIVIEDGRNVFECRDRVEIVKGDVFY